MVGPAGAVVLLLLVITQSGPCQSQLKVFTSSTFNISGHVSDGELVGNVNISKANGDVYSGRVVNTELGIQAKGRGVIVYGINGLVYEGDFDNGDPNGRGLVRMPLQSSLESSSLTGCSGCRQEMDDSGKWWLIVEGDAKSTGNGWIIVSQTVKDSISQHAAIVNINDGRYGVGQMINGRMEGSGFLKVFHKSYQFNGPLHQKCTDIEEQLDEDSLSSNLTEDMISYWTNMESYEGEFSNGNPHGVGKMRLGTGEVIEGRFYQGKPVCYGNVAFQTVETCSKAPKKIESHGAICTEDQLVFKAIFVGGIPGLWLPPVNGCGEVPEVLHSTATFSANDTVKYACERDFTMVGHDTVACKEGMWSPQPPSCHQRPPSICDSSPCHPTALCSPITSGYKCQCKDDKEGDPYFAGCHSTTRFTDVISDASRSTCGYKPASSTTNHIQCGGSVSALEAPWQVSIVSVKSLQRIHWCGGVLVSLTHVLSSAHCFQSAQCNILSRMANNKCNKSLFLAFFGRSNATILHPDDMLLDDVNSVHREIEEVYLHPDWQYTNPVSNGNDISILTVKAVPMNAFIKPACLPNPSSHFFLHQELNGHIEITGFGRNGSFNAPLRTSTPHQLQLVDMKIIDKLVCDSKLTGQVAPDVFCAVPGHDEKGVCMGKPGTCEGDSGGPAVVKDTLGQYIVIGLVSGGPPCGEDESVHPHRLTSVSHHLSFIIDHMEALPCPPPVGAPPSPTCSLSFAQFVSDLPCYDKIDCPAGGRCLNYSCTLFQDDDDTKIARTQCVSSQQCRDGAFMCDAITRRCRPDKAGNGTDIQVSGGVRTLFVPKTSSLGAASLPKRKRSSCGGYYPCPVRTTDGRRACKSAYCNQFRRCWCPYPVSLLLDTTSGKFVDPE